MPTSIIASNALTTYAAAKSRINAIGSQIVDATHQNEVERLINAVSDAIEEYCGREFYKAARTETYAPPRGERLVVNVTPIASSPAPTATVDGSSVSVDIENAKAGWLHCEGGWQGDVYEDAISGSVTLSTVPGSAEETASVTYTAGYVTPHQVANLNVDPDNEQSVHTLYEPDAPAKAGTLTVTTTANTTHTHLTVAWNDGAASTLINASEILLAALPATYNLGTLDADLTGFFLVVSADAVTTASSVIYTVAAGESTRDLPWDLEEAAIMSVAILWKMRMGGYSADVMQGSNSAIGRGEGGILPDAVLPILNRYRRAMV